MASATDAEINAAVNAPGKGNVMVQAPAENLTSKTKPYGQGQYTDYTFDARSSIPNKQGNPYNVRTTLKIHDADVTAKAGSNSATGTTLGIEQGRSGVRRVVPDASSSWGGRWIHADTASEEEWNLSHIPVFRF
jgi:hypothetical protein